MNAVELFITGNVQRVGYRNIVSQAAFELGINGFAENLPDESVRIVVQGDKRKIEKFIGRIKIKKWPINVENIKQRSIATKTPFRRFAIIRGKPMQEMAERADEAALYMHKMYNEMHDMNSEMQGMHNEMKGANTQMHGLRNEAHGMHSEMKGFRDDTNRNFSKLDTKYGSLSKKMNGVSGKLDNTNQILREEFRKLSNALLIIANKAVQKQPNQ